MTTLLAVLFCVFLPGLVCAVEYWHGWSKIYNRVYPTINRVLGTHLEARTWPEPHNTVTHQFKVFCVWLAIGGLLFIVLDMLICYW